MAIFFNPLSPIQYPEFTTHNNYIAYLRNISKNLEINLVRKPTGSFTLNGTAQKKLRLIEMTAKSIVAEAKMVRAEPDFSVVAISWMPVKAYYLFFNFLVFLEYLYLSDSSFLSTTHARSLSKLRDLVESGHIVFSAPEFNMVKSGKEIGTFKVPKSENLKATSPFRKEQIFKKMADYCKDELRRKNKVTRLSKKHLTTYGTYKFALIDLLYWYRIKVNYRDLEFLSSGIPSSDFKSMYTNYFHLTSNIYFAMKKCINEIGAARGMGRII